MTQQYTYTDIPHTTDTSKNTHYMMYVMYAFVWLKIAAPSDLLLDVVRFTNVLTYLLT